MKVRTTITEVVKVQTLPGPIVDAHQFTREFTPDGVVPDSRNRGAFKLDRPGPTLTLTLGTWVITAEDGSRTTLSPRLFSEQYNPVEEADKPKPTKKRKGAVKVAQMGVVDDQGRPLE